MSNFKKFWPVVLFVVVSFLQWKMLGYLRISVDFLSNFLTFLSIIFGFYITGLAIFVTSNYVSGLYKITDEKRKNLTLLNILVENYKRGLNVILFSIIYSLALLLVAVNSTNESIYLYKWFALPFSFIILLNFIYSYLMLGDLIKIVLQEAKRVNSQDGF